MEGWSDWRLVKLATRIAVSLVVGVLATWLVAWCAVIRAGSIIETLDQMLPTSLPDDWELAPAEGWAEEASVKTAAGVEIVWSAVGASVGGESAQGGFVWRVRAGWPMLALESWETLKPYEDYGLPLRRGFVAFLPTGEIHLPTHVRVVPFLVNTTCFSVLCFALFARRGASASRCPECGGGEPRMPVLALSLTSLAFASVLVVAMAWCVVLVPRNLKVPERLWILDRPSFIETSWIDALFGDPARAPWEVVPPSNWPRQAVRTGPDRFPRFGQAHRRAFGHMRPTVSAEWSASGWPLCVMESRRFHTSDVGPREVSFDSGIPLSIGGNTRYLPLRPMLVPFAFNTGVLAAVVLVLRVVFWHARCWRRARCNQCLRCGYSLCGLVA